MNVESAIVAKLRKLSPQQQQEVLKFINSLEKGLSASHSLQDNAKAAKEADLQKLLDKVTPENLHSEVSTGEAVGREIG
jgi:antitoxin component of MazEF toxin-antitoxin module